MEELIAKAKQLGISTTKNDYARLPLEENQPIKATVLMAAIAKHLETYNLSDADVQVDMSNDGYDGWYDGVKITYEVPRTETELRKAIDMTISVENKKKAREENQRKKDLATFEALKKKLGLE
jgi:hypothetical protein